MQHDEMPSTRRAVGPRDDASARAVIPVRPGARVAEEDGRQEAAAGHGRAADARAVRDAAHVLALRWRTAVAVAAAVMGLAAVYLFAADPVYDATVVLQVEDRRNADPGRPDALAPPEGRTEVATEMRLLRSRSVLEAVAAELALDVEAQPLYAPLVGRAAARRHRGESPAAAPWGLGSFAWGGERIRVDRLVVPDDLLDQPLTLTALGDGRFRLESQGGVLVDGGAAGETATAGGVEIRVGELVARPGTRFEVVRHDRVTVADALARDLQIEESGGSGKTGVIEVELEGRDAREVARVLNAIAQTWLRQRAARQAEELQFVEAQLAKLAPKARRAERALGSFQRDSGGVSPSRQAGSLVDQAAALEKELSALELEYASLSRGRTDDHPDVQSLRRKIEAVRARRAALDERMRRVPDAELESARLSRDVKVISDLYGLLLTRAEELRIARPGALEGVRVVDAAVAPRLPARPRPPLVLAGALLLAVTGGLAAAFARHALRDPMDAPDDVERHAGVPVYVAIPHSPEQGRLERAAGGGGRIPLLAGVAPRDRAVEALRSLRTALDFALVVARSNVIAVASPARGAGKSFVAANLAMLAAQAGRRVLLVDADLRRGRLHAAFALPQAPGLTDAITGAAGLDAAARPTCVPGLDLMSTGPMPPNPSELLATQRFGEVVAALAQRYDLVLVDTAPIVAVADGALAASRAGVNLLVLRAGRQSMHETMLSIERLAHAGTTVRGAILNDVRPVRGAHGGYGGRSAPFSR